MHQNGNSMFDWFVTGLLALWGFIVGQMTLGDWVTVATLFLVMLKMAHEVLLIWRTLRSRGT